MVACEEQALAEDGKLSTILETSITRSEQYYKCSSNHKLLVEWIRAEIK